MARRGSAIRLVTLDIGGNDLLALPRTEPCASAPTGEACRQTVIATLARFEDNYRTILERLTRALRESAPDARLLVLTYYNPFSGTGVELEVAGDGALLGDDRRIDCDAARVPANRGMNDILSCVASEFGAEVVDGYPPFVGRGTELSLILSYDIHPNDAGYAALTDVLAEAYLGPVRASRQR